MPKNCITSGNSFFQTINLVSSWAIQSTTDLPSIHRFRKTALHLIKFLKVPNTIYLVCAPPDVVLDYLFMSDLGIPTITFISPGFVWQYFWLFLDPLHKIWPHPTFMRDFILTFQCYMKKEDLWARLATCDFFLLEIHVRLSEFLFLLDYPKYPCHLPFCWSWTNWC